MKVSGGYPLLSVFRLICYGKLMSSGISLILQVIILASINGQGNISCDIIFAITVGSSFIIFIITSSYLCFKRTKDDFTDSLIDNDYSSSNSNTNRISLTNIKTLKNNDNTIITTINRISLT